MPLALRTNWKREFCLFWRRFGCLSPGCWLVLWCEQQIFCNFNNCAIFLYIFCNLFLFKMKWHVCRAVLFFFIFSFSLDFYFCFIYFISVYNICIVHKYKRICMCLAYIYIQICLYIKQRIQERLQAIKLKFAPTTYIICYRKIFLWFTNIICTGTGPIMLNDAYRTTWRRGFINTFKRHDEPRATIKTSTERVTHTADQPFKFLNEKQLISICVLI